MTDVRLPAHMGLIPNKIQWNREKINSSSVLLLKSFIKNIKDVFRSETIGNAQIEFFLAVLENGEKRFCKLIKGAGKLDLEFEIELTSYLLDHDIEVPVTCSVVENVNSNNKLLLVQSYVEGRYTNFSVKDAELLGLNVANLHESLKSYPMSSVIEQRSSVYLNELVGVLSSVTEIKKTPQLDEIYGALSSYKVSDFDCFMENAQVVHGDLNAGNVIFHNGKVKFIDFEESIRSNFNPITDVAFCIERCIQNGGDPGDVIRRIKSFRSAYESVSGSVLCVEEVARIQELLSVRALLVLTKGLQRSPYKPRWDEINKFLNSLSKSKHFVHNYESAFSR